MAKYDLDDVFFWGFVLNTVALVIVVLANAAPASSDHTVNQTKAGDAPAKCKLLESEE